MKECEMPWPTAMDVERPVSIRDESASEPVFHLPSAFNCRSHSFALSGVGCLSKTSASI